MANSASLSIRVLVDAAQGAAELRGLGDSATGTGDKLKNLVAAGAAFAGVTALIKRAVDAASNLQQSTGGVEAVFKDSASAVKTFASEAARSLGLSQSAYQELATVIGSQLKNAGTSMEELAPKTNKLITTGADLAAMFGGTTAEAVGALSSALKGERDPIERYGVSLNQAAIDAKILALGLDTSTNAAKQAATQQATLAIIYEQTADAQGAAAREADSYASVMQTLGALWENTLAQVGTALLPALSQLAGTLGDLMPAVASILTPLAGLLAMVLDLPGPLLAAAGAFAAWQIMGGLSGITAALSTAVTFLTANVKRLWLSLGPIGIAALAIGVAMTFLMDTSNDAREAHEAQAAAAEELKGTLDATTGAVTDATRAYVVNQAQANGMLSTMERLGVDTSAYTEAATGAAGGAERLAGEIASAAAEVLSSSDAYNQVASALDAVGVKQEDFIAAVSSGNIGDIRSKMQEYAESVAAASGNMSDAQTIMTNFDAAVSGATPDLQALDNAASLAGQTTAALGGASDDAAQKQRAMGDAAVVSAADLEKASEEQRKAAEEAAKAAAAQTEVKVALDAVKSAASAASTAVEFYVLQMNLAAGVNVSADQAAKLLNDTLRDTSDAFKGSAEDGGYSMAALTDWNVAALTSTERGSSIYDSLTKMQTAYATSTTAAYSSAAASGDTAAGMSAAATAADSAYAAFITMATSATGSSVAAEQLAAKLGIVQGTNIDPKTFELIAQDQQADQALADIQNTEIAPKTVEVGAIVGEATGAFSTLVGQKLDNTVAVDANLKQAQTQIQGLTSEKRTTTPVAVTADPSQAVSTVAGFTTAQRTTTVGVQASTTAAQGAITALVNQQRTLTITVAANTGPAASAIASIVHGSYTATINVTANTAAARAAIASVPTVVVASAPAPAGFAPTVSGLAAPDTAAFQAAAYPPLHGSRLAAPRSAESGAGTTYVINVTGGLDSADTIARRVDDIIRRRERRIHGVSVQA
jgi:hypothetical protein